MTNEELSIGEETIIRVKCVEDGKNAKIGCERCALYSLCTNYDVSPSIEHTMCIGNYREDEKDVHYEIVDVNTFPRGIKKKKRFGFYEKMMLVTSACLLLISVACFIFKNPGAILGWFFAALFCMVSAVPDDIAYKDEFINNKNNKQNGTD